VLNDIKLDLTPRTGKVSDYGADAFRLVKVDTYAQEELWTLLISTWHFLGAQKIVGPRIKYLIYLGAQPIGALSYTWVPLKLRPLDDYIGWDDEQKKELLPHCLSQHRFLLCPWIAVRYLASHILSKSLKVLKADWKEKYGSDPFLCITYVDASRYQGICYKAAGWINIGKTQGYGWKKGNLEFHGDQKHVFLTFMDKRFWKSFQRQQKHQRLLVDMKMSR